MNGAVVPQGRSGFPGITVIAVTVVMVLLVLLAGGGSEEAGAEEKEPDWSYTAGDYTGAVKVSKDGNYVAVGARHDKIYLFHRDSPVPLWSYKPTRQYVLIRSIDISANGEYIVVGTDDMLYLFNRNSSEPLWTFKSPTYKEVSISDDGEYIAVGFGSYGWTKTSYGAVRLFGKNDSEPIWTLETDFNIISIAISANGENIVAGSNSRDDEVVMFFHRSSSTPLWNFSRQEVCGGSSVDISADGRYIVTGQGHPGKNISLFRNDSNQPLWRYEVGYYSVVSISDDGEYISAGAQGSDYVYYFHRNSSTPLWKYEMNDSASKISISETGKYFGVSSRDHNVYFFEGNSSIPLWNYTMGDAGREISLSKNGRCLAVGSNDFNVYFFTNPFYARIEGISPNPALHDDIIRFNCSVTIEDIVRYVWRSSIDGEFYNGTESEIEYNRLTGGTHTIYLRVQDSWGVWSDEVSTSLVINGKPVAFIDNISPNPAHETDDVMFRGYGMDDGHIVRYVWRSSLDGELYNGTEPEFQSADLSMGTHTIFFMVCNNFGIWSDDVGAILEVEEEVIEEPENPPPDSDDEKDDIDDNDDSDDSEPIPGDATPGDAHDPYDDNPVTDPVPGPNLIPDPDLSITHGDIVFGRSPALQGQDIPVTVTIYNAGGPFTGHVTVRIMVLDEFGCYTNVGEATITGGLDSYEKKSVSITFTPDIGRKAFENGKHGPNRCSLQLRVEVDPEGYVFESDTENNDAMKEIIVVQKASTVDSFGTTLPVLILTVLVVAAVLLAHMARAEAIVRKLDVK
jgi:6-phosphogluconolactonase (cycloisomerase 2 family)